MLRTAACWLAPLALVACGGPNAEDVPLPNPAGANCGTEDPTISDLTIVDGGEQDFGGELYPTVTITTRASDPDGDLHHYSMRVWWDEDPVVAEAMEGRYVEVWGTVDEEPCSVMSSVFETRIAVANGNPPFDTELTWAVLVFDDMDRPSDGGSPAVQTFTTPAEAR